jgi:glycosyltransferase 2 family protein
LTSRTASWSLQSLSLLVVLISLHPRILNFGIRLLKRLKGKNKVSEGENTPVLTLDHYPLWPLLGEIGFLGLRSAGFLLTFLALQTPTWAQVPQLISTFSLAWLLGLVVPGAPGGIGVFEATAIALLGQAFSPALILSVVALYRLISILAEGIGAGLAAVPNVNFKLRA